MRDAVQLVGEVGVELASRVGARVGYPPADVEVLEQLVRHHLLLGDVASRRDLDEMATIDVVADAVGTVSQLRLLAALTEADAKATGPTAWGSWRAGLVQTLVVRVAARLGGEAVPLDASARWRDSDDLADLARRGPQIVAGRA